MSHLTFQEKVLVIERAICCPGHGKCEVDAVNGVGKNTIHRMAMKTSKTEDPGRMTQKIIGTTLTHMRSTIGGTSEWKNKKKTHNAVV